MHGCVSGCAWLSQNSPPVSGLPVCAITAHSLWYKARRSLSSTHSVHLPGSLPCSLYSPPKPASLSAPYQIQLNPIAADRPGPTCACSSRAGRVRRAACYGSVHSHAPRVWRARVLDVQQLALHALSHAARIPGAELHGAGGCGRQQCRPGRSPWRAAHVNFERKDPCGSQPAGQPRRTCVRKP